MALMSVWISRLEQSHDHTSITHSLFYVIEICLERSTVRQIYEPSSCSVCLQSSFVLLTPRAAFRYRIIFHESVFGATAVFAPPGGCFLKLGI